MEQNVGENTRHTEERMVIVLLVERYNDKLDSSRVGGDYQ
jgi:hypothetical protein